MGCFVRGDKNCMGCFVRGGKLMRDVLSGVAKNGMGCFVSGCFVLHSCLVQGPQRCEARTLSLESCTLPLSHCTPTRKLSVSRAFTCLFTLLF